MKMKLKIIHLLSVCAALALGPAAREAAAQESPTLRKIAETGLVTIGFRDKSIPFSYLDKQRPIGYSIDICLHVVDAVRARLKQPDIEVVYRPATSASRMALVANGIIDLECGSTTNTVERQREVAFSVTTFVASNSLVTKKANGFNSLAQLRGQTVVSTAGGTPVKGLLELNRALGLELRVITAKDNVDSFNLLETDRAAAFAMDDALLYGLVADARNPQDYLIYHADMSVEPYGIVLRKDDPVFKKLVDDAIVGLYRSGAITQLYRKWFLTPIPPKQILLNLPMSPALKKLLSAPTDSADPAAYR
ncbi:amino acid ABC transporter substrate-binding protein, PAAT family [Pseudoduganella namucuonensis]|uniref:Amino acid ABC transporter substrate-binding protein, PAAT family n=2 Tax=Pseudoduganella namucuonensis TaxID=1035707 RepID=A0A1I7LNE8_9BURK|nr:amino acid ABC transporter substrate-binding protein, PAAT family [Pseudoduganella namucuonensis]